MNEDPLGEVSAGIITIDAIGATNLDGAVLAEFAFAKASHFPTDLHVSILEVGAAVGYDYPIGFTIEL